MLLQIFLFGNFTTTRVILRPAEMQTRNDFLEITLFLNIFQDLGSNEKHN